MATVKGTSGNDFIDLSDGVTNGADYIYGLAGNDTLKGFGGSDWIFGGDGKDSLYGGDGGDVLDGGTGADTLDGGDGVDLANYISSPDGINVSLLTGSGGGGSAEGDQLIRIENVAGSNYDDTLAGNESGNQLYGHAGSDQLKGLGGDDGLFGHEGNDTLLGMDGDDGLAGGDGSDSISGGLGKDTCWGGDGPDTFVWSSSAEASFEWVGEPGTMANSDLIGDFDPAEGDLMDLSEIDADVYAAGDQAFTFIGTAPFSGAPGEINYYHFCGLTYIQMQTGTSTDTDAMIRLIGIHTPEASWFVL